MQDECRLVKLPHMTSHERSPEKPIERPGYKQRFQLGGKVRDAAALCQTDDKTAKKPHEDTCPAEG